MKNIDIAIERKTQIFDSISFANRWSDETNESNSETMFAILCQHYSKELSQVVTHDTINI